MNGDVMGILPLYPSGTNSTFFTTCCECAISDDEGTCPSCDRKVVGCDDESSYERGRTRWNYAYKG